MKARLSDNSGTVRVRNLGSTLRQLVRTCLDLGDAWQWEPDAESEAAAHWRTAATDPLARTLAEADGHGVLLLRSGLEHADVVGHSLSAGRAFVPLTIGRTAAEHCLRAHYLFDSEIPDLERAGRRINEWLHALEEREKQRVPIVKAKHPRADEIKDGTAQRLQIDARVAALGLTLVGSGDRRRVLETEKRPGPMTLSERYLSHPEAYQVTSTAFRTKSAFTHGLETALLAAAVEEDTAFDVQRFRPRQMESGEMAFALLSVPLAVFNASRAMATSFGKRSDDIHWLRVIRARDRMLASWSAALTEHLDVVAPDRPRTGLIGPLDN